MAVPSIVPRLIAAGSVALVIAATAPASAHDIVVFPERQGAAVALDVRYGHPADWQPIVPDKLYSFSIWMPDGSTASWRGRLKLDGADLRAVEPVAGDGVALFAAQYDNGYWSKDDAGETVNTSRASLPRTPRASHNLKYAKALIDVGGASRSTGFDRVVGHKLELVPMADPLSVKPGDTLPVAVRFAGRPLAGVGVEIGDSVTALPEDSIPRYRTDAKGIAQVPVGKSGWAVLGVDHEERSTTPKLADLERYTATFVFRVK